MKQIQNASTFQNCQEFCCTNKIVPKFLHHPNVNKNVSNDFENITHMNYLNPYIALGGRNPFRACFFSGTKKVCPRNNFCSVFLVLKSKKLYEVKPPLNKQARKGFRPPSAM